MRLSLILLSVIILASCSKESATINGFVYFEKTAVPIEQVTVSLDGISALSDQDGRFTLSGIEPGSHELTASKADYQSSSKILSIVGSSSIADVFLYLNSDKNSGSLKTAVIDSDGIPVPRALVTMLNPDNSPSELFTYSDFQGKVELAGIPMGTRYFVAEKSGFISSSITAVISASPGVVEFKMEMEKSSFRDARDNKVYRTVNLGSQTWMADNLAWLPSVYLPEDRSDTEARYYVYNFTGSDPLEAKSTAFFDEYGVLYNYAAGSNGGCPEGWRLPADNDWQILFDYLIANGYGYEGSGEDIAKSLSSTSGWQAGTNAGAIGNDPSRNDLSGFSARPAGILDERGFTGAGFYTIYFSTSESSPGWHKAKYLDYNYNGVYLPNVPLINAFSVRCLKN